MRICVDARSLNRPHLRGIGRMLKEIIQHSPKHYQWLLFADRKDLPFHTPKHANAKPVIIPERGYRFHAWEQIIFPSAATWHRGDLLFCPANSAPALVPMRKVSVVHDVIQWKNEFCSQDQLSAYQRIVVPKSLLHSTRIVTVSRTSAQEIRSLWPGTTAEVIYNGVSETFLQPSSMTEIAQAQVKLQLKPPYVVYVGGEIPRKRFDWAVRSWRPLAAQVQLVTCGISADQGSAIAAQIAPETHSQIRYLEFMPDEHLRHVLTGASCILYPTLYEGFGLPVVEANAVGTPIVYSSCGSLAEIVGPLSNVVAKDDLGRWTRAIDNWGSIQLSEKERDKGRTWAKHFCWKDSAKAYHRVLEEASSA